MVSDSSCGMFCKRFSHFHPQDGRSEWGQISLLDLSSSKILFSQVFTNLKEREHSSSLSLSSLFCPFPELVPSGPFTVSTQHPLQRAGHTLGPRRPKGVRGAPRGAGGEQRPRMEPALLHCDTHADGDTYTHAAVLGGHA